MKIKLNNASVELSLEEYLQLAEFGMADVVEDIVTRLGQDDFNSVSDIEENEALDFITELLERYYRDQEGK